MGIVKKLDPSEPLSQQSSSEFLGNDFPIHFTNKKQVIRTKAAVLDSHKKKLKDQQFNVLSHFS